MKNYNKGSHCKWFGRKFHPNFDPSKPSFTQNKKKQTFCRWWTFVSLLHAGFTAAILNTIWSFWRGNNNSVSQIAAEDKTGRSSRCCCAQRPC
jgi:hypothetical protein